MHEAAPSAIRFARSMPIHERRRMAHDGIAEVLLWAANLIGPDQPDALELAQAARLYRQEPDLSLVPGGALDAQLQLPLGRLVRLSAVTTATPPNP